MADRGSSHAECDLMYAVGLSCDRIAQLCHTPRSTVYAYFHQRTMAEPTLRQEHENHAENPSTRGWNRVLADPNAFTADTVRWPNPAGDHREASVARWLADQRRRDRRGELSADRIAALDDAGPWRYSSRALADDYRWWTRSEQVIDFCRDLGSWPHWKTAADEHEPVLWVWLHEQHQKSARGILPAAKHRALAAHLPGWNPSAATILGRSPEAVPPESNSAKN